MFGGMTKTDEARFAEKCFTQIYRDLYGDAMLELIRMGTNMAPGNQQKHLPLSFATWIYLSRNTRSRHAKA